MSEPGLERDHDGQAPSRRGDGPPRELIARLDDPVAERTDWTPAAPGGITARTHRLVKVSPVRLELRLTHEAWRFCLVFVFLGALALVASVGSISGTFAKMLPVWPFLVAGVVFTGAGIILYRSLSRPRVFDMQDLWYWRGKRPEHREAVEQCVDSAPLDEVHAIQILHEECQAKEATFSSYEINLVLHDGRRVNVVDHGALSHIRRDARSIADLIGVPVWDATKYA